jgi:hypothetical protein
MDAARAILNQLGYKILTSAEIKALSSKKCADWIAPISPCN